MTREDIEKFSDEEPYCFGYCGEAQKRREERWYEIGCIDGLRVADAEPNLESLWHNASEEPIEYPILCKDELSNIWIEHSLTNYVEGWAECVEFNDISQWAYISDLFPKGGKK